MKDTSHDEKTYRQLSFWDYQQKDTAERKDEAEVYESRGISEYNNLKRAGINARQAWMWANTRKGYWRTAKSPILTRAISNDLLKKAKYLSLMDCYTAT